MEPLKLETSDYWYYYYCCYYYYYNYRFYSHYRRQPALAGNPS